jgi:hypothetical protein
MRATCENCGQVQPPDWQPGDLCTHCGVVVRREQRCHWCVALTPAGKYCRHCGAGQVPDAQYGAARWLKHVGADQLVIPERLAAMDPEQVAHFTRLYQRHAIVAERHLDDLALAEGFARRRGWARALEQHLLPLLPLADADLAALTTPPLRGTTDAEKLLEIRQHSPFPLTQLLAALARLRLWQASGSEAEYSSQRIWQEKELAQRYLEDADPALRTEAALTLSHWRLVCASAQPPYGPLHTALHEALTGPFGVEAATGLALLTAQRLGTAQPVPTEALGAENSDLAFAAALASHAPDPLLAALRVPARSYAAARTLTRMGVAFNLAPLLPGFSPYELTVLLSLLISQERARPDLRPFLQAAVAGQLALEPSLRRAALDLLTRDLQPGDAVRLVRENPDRSFISKLLQNPALTPPELVAVCRELVEQGVFTTDNAPLAVYAQLPFSFIPEVWRTAPAASLQGLRPLANRQLATYSPGEALALADFLRAVLRDETAAPEARRQAQYVLTDWYRGYGHPSQLRLSFAPAAAASYFGSFEAYIAYFVHGLEHLPSLVALEGDSDFLRPLEAAAEPAGAAELLAALAQLPAPLTQRLRQGLTTLARTYDNWAMPRRWAVGVLALLQQHAPWREAVRADLQSLQASGDGQIDYLAERALADG